MGVMSLLICLLILPAWIYLCLPLCLNICLTVSRFVCLYLTFSVCMFVRLFVCLYISFSIRISLSLSVDLLTLFPSVYLYFYLSVFLSVSLSFACLSPCPPNSQLLYLPPDLHIYLNVWKAFLLWIFHKLDDHLAQQWWHCEPTHFTCQCYSCLHREY